jgi:hypothetical protein
MASPDPNKPLGDRDRVERDVGAGVGYGWIWILIAIIIILVVWFGGFGWGSYGGWWWGNRPRTAVVQPNTANGQNAGLATNGQPAGNNAALGGAGVQILTATNKQAFVGQPFDIRNVPVQNTSNKQAFWIGANNIPPMLVVIQGNNSNSANPNVQQGDRVNVTGTVTRAPSAANAKNMWKLSDDDANRLEQQGVYIQATEVQAAQATQP